MDEGKMKENNPESGTISIEVIRPKSHIGLFGAVAFGMGSMIGSGIFISPSGALRSSGSVGMSLVIWTLSGVISMFVGLVYAELGSMMPQSGGDYNYIRKGLGDSLAFQAAWCLPLFNNTASMAVLSIVFADYFLIGIVGTCKPPVIINRLIALAVILSIGISNVYSARAGAYIQQIATLAKSIALAIIIIGGLIFLFQGSDNTFRSGFEGSVSDIQSYSVSIYTCIFAYGGYTRIGDIADEIIDPRRNVPRGLIISISLVTLLYVMTNVSFFTLLTKHELVTSSAVGYDWALKCMKPAAFLISVSVLISVYGAMNGNAFAASRVMFSAARAGHYPEVMSYLAVKSSVPVVSLVVFHGLILPYLLAPGDVFVLINFLSFIGILVNLLATVSLLRLRYKTRNEMKEDNVFQSPLFIPIATVFVLLFLLITPFVSDPRLEFLYGVAIILAGVLVFIIFVRYSVKLPGMDKVTCFLQLLCNVGPTAKVD